MPEKAQSRRFARLGEEQQAVSPSPEGVSIELTAAQIAEVVRSATDVGNLAVVLAGLGDARDVLGAARKQLEDPHLSRSLLHGLLLLSSFPQDGSHIANAELSRIAGLNPSTTHRYVSTLVAAGLIERDPETRRYRLSG